ncbi:MAG: sugar transferase [Candidatus Omnitrophica bacterium]|nr:sugar transferase [Candidatus Omnitrophota bacterium]
MISQRSFFLLSCDLLSLAIAYVFGFGMRTGFNEYALSRLSFLYFSFIVFPILFYTFDLYYPYKHFGGMQTFIDVVLAVVTGIILSAAAAYADRSLILPRLIFFYTMISLIPTIYAARLFYDFLFGSRLLDKKVIVIGTGPLALEIVRTIRATPHSGMDIVGLVSTKKVPSEKKHGIPITGSLKDLITLIDWYNIQLVVMALEAGEDHSETHVMADLLMHRVQVVSSIHLFERLTQEIPYKLLGPQYLLGLMSQVKIRPYLKMKRVLDLITASLLLIFLLPVFMFALFFLSITARGKIFFYQDRIGKDSIPFRLYKLRTMAESQKGHLYITRFGGFLRKFRIDEIPQLWNVIKGDMSLIGPRPEIPYFVTRCRKRIPFYDAVFAVKPGLTGWAQVKFRYTVSAKDYEQKFRYNLYYLKNISFALDLLIVLKTIRVVSLGRGK